MNWEKEGEREGGRREREREPGLCSFCTVAAAMLMCECVSVNWEKEREGGREKEREREPGLCSFCTVAAAMLM